MNTPGNTGANRDWVNFRRDDETGIESINAHFRGHAYDPHDHDEVLVGVTVQGLQRFNCHRTLHTSQPGRAILIEPGAVHHQEGHLATFKRCGVSGYRDCRHRPRHYGRALR